MTWELNAVSISRSMPAFWCKKECNWLAVSCFLRIEGKIVLADKTKLSSKAAYRSRHALSSRRLRCESLERRALLAALLVTTADSVGPGSITEAIEIANNQETNPGLDVIRFARNVRGTIELTEQLVVTDDLRIEGPGARRLELSGGGVTRIMTLLSMDPSNPTEASIRNLTFANGFATDAAPLPEEFAFGGAIHNIGGVLTLDGMVFRDNVVTGGLAAGGAVANEFGGILNVSRTLFENNTSTGFLIGVGGAIASDIGPTEDGEGTPIAVLNVSSSTFEGNSATASVNDPSLNEDFAAFSGFAFGGAISALSTDATILNSRFINNSVQGGVGEDGQDGGFANGGAIFADDFSPFDAVGLPGRDSSMTIIGSTFEGNESTGGAAGLGGETGGGAAGGAVSISISFFPDTGLISHSRFRNNSATGGVGEQGGLAIGGALSVLTGAEVEVHKSQFTANVAQGGESELGDGGDGIGGAIGLGQLQPSADFPLLGLPPTVKIASTFFSRNEALGGNGGAAGNGGLGAGGALGTVSGTAEVVRSRFIRNQAQGGSAGMGGDAKGGAVYNSGAELKLARSFVFANLAEAGEGVDAGGLGYGGGIFNDLENPDSAIDIDRFTKFFTRFNDAEEGDNLFGV